MHHIDLKDGEITKNEMFRRSSRLTGLTLMAIRVLENIHVNFRQVLSAGVKVLHLRLLFRSIK